MDFILLLERSIFFLLKRKKHSYRGNFAWCYLFLFISYSCSQTFVMYQNSQRQAPSQKQQRYSTQDNRTSLVSMYTHERHLSEPRMLRGQAHSVLSVSDPHLRSENPQHLLKTPSYIPNRERLSYPSPKAAHVTSYGNHINIHQQPQPPMPHTLNIARACSPIPFHVRDPSPPPWADDDANYGHTHLSGFTTDNRISFNGKESLNSQQHKQHVGAESSPAIKRPTYVATKAVTSFDPKQIISGQLRTHSSLSLSQQPHTSQAGKDIRTTTQAAGRQVATPREQQLLSMRETTTDAYHPQHYALLEQHREKKRLDDMRREAARVSS